MYILCNLYVSREGALLAKTKSALSLLIYWNAECCGALWTSMNTSNFLWQSALSMIAPWWFIKGYCKLVGCSSICCLRSDRRTWTTFSVFFFLYFHLKQETVFYGFHSENIFLEKNTWENQAILNQFVRDLAETIESGPLCITDLFKNKLVAYFLLQYKSFYNYLSSILCKFSMRTDAKYF